MRALLTRLHKPGGAGQPGEQAPPAGGARQRLRAAAGRLPQALRGGPARRLSLLGGLLAAVWLAVTVLFASAERPGALPSGGPAAPPGTRAAATTVTAAAPPTTAGPAWAGEPGAAAAAWYAREHGLAGGRVRALQVQAVDERTVRVLVLAERSGGRVTTALVTVRRGEHGRWQAPARAGS